MSIGQTRFFTEIDSRDVIVSQPFQIRFTVENGQPTNFRAPDWNGLEVIQGPNRSMQTSFINGQMSSQTSFIYLVSAPDPGKYTIGIAEVDIDNRRWTTEAISIHARKDEEVNISAENIGEPYFIIAVLDTNEAIVGQQVLLEYKLYTRVEINSYDILKAPSYEGVYFRNLPIFQRRAKKEVVDGVEYTSQVLRRVALFPQQSGTLKIDPMYFQLGVVDRQERRSFFFSSRIKPVRINTKPIELYIKKLPSPLPENYAGVIGSLAMSTRWDKSRISVNDGLSLKLTLSTDSDPKQVVAPDLNFGPSFEVYPPNLINDEVNETSGKVLVTKTWEYILVPLEPGNYKLDFSLSYFDVDSSSFQVQRSAPWALTVIPGIYAPGTSFDGNGKNVEFHSPDLENSHRPVQSLWWGSLVYWMIFSIPIITGVIFFSIRKLRDKEARTAIIDRNYKKALEQAHRMMADAKKARDDKDRGRFYKSAAKAFLGYAAHRLKVSPNNVTRKDMKKYLSKAGIENAIIDKFIEFWDRLDTAQYAPLASEFSLEETYDQAIELMSELEATLEKV
jgi:hypothetical protein